MIAKKQEPDLSKYIDYHEPGKIQPPERLTQLIGDKPIACWTATCLCSKVVVYSFVSGESKDAYVVALMHLVNHRLSCETIVGLKRCAMQ